jgi:hypothetical protein
VIRLDGRRGHPRRDSRVPRTLLSALTATGLLAGLSGCSSGDSPRPVSDEEAIAASGATNCAPRPKVPLVRTAFECADGETRTIFNTSLLRQAMAQAAAGSGVQHVVKQADNWMLTRDD